MHRLPQPVKLWYWGPYFRHERPQAGRYRQFHQLDAEAIGSDSPLVDAELIMLLDDLLRELGVPGAAAAALEPRHAGLARRLPRGAARLPARPRGRARPPTSASGSTRTRCAPSTPRTRRHAGGDGRGAADGRPPRPGRRRALRRGPQPARPGRASTTCSTAPSSAGSTTTPGPCSSSSPRRSTPRRRRSAAAGATTAWSRRSAARRRPGCGWAAGIERILLALDEPEPEPVADVVRRRRPSEQRERAFALVRSCAAPACAPSSTSPGARSRDR